MRLRTSVARFSVADVAEGDIDVVDVTLAQFQVGCHLLVSCMIQAEDSMCIGYASSIRVTSEQHAV